MRKKNKQNTHVHKIKTTIFIFFFTWFNNFASIWLSALMYLDEPGPTMSHHFSSVHSQPPIRFSSCAGVRRRSSRQKIFRLSFCALVRMSVYHGLVQRKQRSLAIRCTVALEMRWPCRKSLRTTFGAVIFGSLKSSSHRVMISAFFRLGLARFSPRRSRNGFLSGDCAASLYFAMVRYTKDLAAANLEYFSVVA